MADVGKVLRRLGGGVIDKIWRLGYASRFHRDGARGFVDGVPPVLADDA
jgi:hypothetical protein